MQNNILKLREGYLKTLKLTVFLSFPIAGLIFVLASDFTKIFLGDEWILAIPIIQVLALAGLARSIGATTGPLLYALNKPKIITKIQLIRLFILIVFIYPLTIKWGILGVSTAVLLSNFISSILLLISVALLTKCKIKQLSTTIIFPFVNISIIVLLILLLKNNFTAQIGILSFLLLSSFSILIYLGITYLFGKYLEYDMKTFIKSL